MPLTERLFSHLRRICHHAGRGPVLTRRRFRMAGYFPNRMASDMTVHEPNMNGVIAMLLQQRPQGFWDIGANIGQTLIKVLAAAPEASYLGFEPQIQPAAQIDDFINRNGLSNCRIFPIALGDRNGCAWLFHNSDTDEMASLADSHLGGDAARATVVMLRRGDELFHELGCVDMGVLKIDAEGAEIGVLRGLRQTIARYRPAILLEVLPNFTGERRDWLPGDQREEQSRKAAEILRFLGELGYRLQLITANGSLQRVDAFNLNDRDGFAGYDYLARADHAPA